jgi:hypothetical protein
MKSVALIFSLLAFAFAAISVGAPSASADDSPFGYIYTTDSLPAHQWEYEQWHTLRSGKARGSYTSLDIRNEIEYGITDNLSASLYLKSSYMNKDGVYDPEDVSVNLPSGTRFAINGTSLEFKYRLLSPYKDPIGLSLYLEPEMGIRDQQTGNDVIERALEFRLILQKNFMDDLLVTSFNMMWEPEWEIEGETHGRELWFELTYGAAYRVATNWHVGFELRNHREYPNMDFSIQEHSGWFLGPSAHYANEKWWATVTVLPQIAGSPQNLGVDSSGNAVVDGYRHLGQHEKFEVRAKFGINL